MGEVLEFNLLKEQIKSHLKSGLLPRSVNTPEKALLIAMKGKELGIPPLQALSHIQIIEGKATMSAELMLSQVFRYLPGAQVVYEKSDPTGCFIKAKRPSGEWSRFSFTKTDAENAGLMGKRNWKTYPTAMMRARAISAMCRALFPDAISGVSYTPEELGAEVDGEGTVIDVPNKAETVTKELGLQTASPEKLRELAWVLQKAWNELHPDSKDQLRDWITEKTGKKYEALTEKEINELIEGLNEEKRNLLS